MPLHPALLKTLNTLTFTAAISTMSYYHKFLVHALAGHPNFLSNSHIGFLIPTLSWFLLGGFSYLVQWFDSTHEMVVEAVDWHLFVSNLVITGWVLSWVHDYLVVGQVLLVVNAVLVWRLYSRLRAFTATSLMDYLFVQVSFSVYNALVWLDVFQNFFAAFTTKEGGPESWAAFGAAGALVVLMVIGTHYTEFARDPDSWCGAVIALMTLSITVEQGSAVPVVHMAGLLSVGWLVGALVRRVLRNVAVWHERNQDDFHEGRPLLG
ncbi:hypothetical protein EMPS_11412 [Entomortierella parvispora]|uniref:Transmembrane protein n=1 Tax=Entomortierella parvispora TaxID=205924 RepID=A0A9P3HMS3_9FUNG|nr:hypothetical protein EMPS_11412 [Entomortierella parvispora]